MSVLSGKTTGCQHMGLVHYDVTFSSDKQTLIKRPLFPTNLMSTSKSEPSLRVSFASLTPNNVGTVRKLNSVIFPIKYSEKFYKDILLPEAEDFCKLVYYNDIPVGTICCRLETAENKTSLYCMTMAVLAPYRHRGLGSECLKSIIAAAESHTNPTVDRIYLHVQISNSDAKQFYERNGFTETGIHEGYYKKITPRDAWILERPLHKEQS